MFRGGDWVATDEREEEKKEMQAVCAVAINKGKVGFRRGKSAR